MRRLWVFGLFSLGVASFVCAGQRGAVAPPAAAPAVHAMPAAPSVGAHAAAPSHGAAVRTGTHAGAPGGHAVTTRKTVGNTMQPSQPSSGSNGSSGRNFFPFFPQPTPILPGVSDFFATTYPVPGLGFDFSHFFAVHPNWGRFNPVGGVTLPFFGGGGFYMPVPYYTEATPQEEEPEPNAPQPVSTQRMAPEEPAAPSRTRSGSYMSAEPVPEFVFVKRDGTTFSAVAYSWAKDKLQYVTKDGLRHSAGVDTLDLPATERMNEERGNTVNFPKSLVSSVALSLEPAPLD